MNRAASQPHVGTLRTQLGWFVRLRWGAAAAILTGAAVDHAALHWYAAQDVAILAVGAAILIYNVVLWRMTRALARNRPRRAALLGLSSLQIALDLACLTLLTLWTGGVLSPLLGFFVFHMVFASLLLPSVVAYAGAGLAAGLLSVGLVVTHQWPVTTERSLVLAGWVLTLVLTVYLANHITQSLRRQRRHLRRQNARIRAMSQRLHLQQQAMIQHEKMVAMGHLAAGIVHEIANPLANMDSLLQLVERQPERFSTQTTTLLRQQIQRINQIIRQMSELAHPAQTTTQAVELNEAVEQALRMVRFDRRLERITIETQLAPEAGVVHIQPHALQQALLNLVVNAVDAMANTPAPVLRLRTAAHGAWGTVAVEDNGHGIDPKHLGSLFEPFFTTKPLGQGTGLGLSITYRLIAGQGGDISVQSQPGQGTTFTIRLPRQPQAPQPREPAPPPIPISEN